MRRNISLLVVFVFSFCLLLPAQRRDDSIEVVVDDLEATRVGVSITLRASDSNDTRRSIHMLIGFPEGQSIARAMNHESAERPLTHDLFKAFMDRNGWHVQKVLIRGVRNNTYLADLTLVNDHETQVYDARPSDAMAIALRDGAKIYVSQQVFEMQQQKENQQGNDEEDDEESQPLRRSKPDTLRL